MKSNRENFLELRAQEMCQMYSSDFTKKEAVKTGEALVLDALENGTVDKLQLFANLARLNEVISSAVTTCRNEIEILEKTTSLGVEFNPTSGGNTINYSDDEIWCELKKCLDERTEQLKMAQKQPTFDAYGNEVPKVSTSPRKNSITIKF